MVDTGAEEHLRDARNCINDLEILCKESGLDDPKVAQLKDDAEELRSQLGPESKALKPDPMYEKAHAMLAQQKNAAAVKTQKQMDP